MRAAHELVSALAGLSALHGWPSLLTLGSACADRTVFKEFYLHPNLAEPSQSAGAIPETASATAHRVLNWSSKSESSSVEQFGLSGTSVRSRSAGSPQS